MALVLKFSNNATTAITNSLTPTSTLIDVTPGEGSRFPSLTSGASFYATIVDVSGTPEIVLVTSRNTDQMTVTRAQEGTAAQSWPIGARFEHRVTAGTLSNFLQLSGGTMAGQLDMGGNNLRNVVFPEPIQTNNLRVQYVFPIVPNIDATGVNGLIFPTSGPVRMGRNLPGQSQPLITAAMFRGICFPYYGDLSTLDLSVWKVCDGTDGTPDLRDRFILGAGGLYPTGSIVPAGPLTSLYRDTSMAGSHSHGGATAGHILKISELPAHGHVQKGGGYTETHPSLGYQGISGGVANTQNFTTELTGGGQSHTHGISEHPGHDHRSPPPPFYALIYVMLR